MSADENKNTPEAEAGAAPEKAEVKKPAAKKPATKAEAKSEKPATTKPAAAKMATKKPAAKKPAKAEAESAAAKKPATKKGAKAAAEKPASGKAVAEPVSAKPKAERPAKAKAAKKVAAVPRHGKVGVAVVVDASGKELETRDLSAALFAVPADVNTLHLVVRAEQAARRRGTASTKTRGEVSGSTAKLYRQKGTGRARSGSVKSPLRTGGGVVFGPKPRSYNIKVNRKVVHKALAMALSNRAENGNVYVAAGLNIDEPSTATMNEFLVNLDIAAPVLVVTHDEPGVDKSVRNLSYAEASEVGALSTEQVLRARSLVLTEKAFVALNEA